MRIKFHFSWPLCELFRNCGQALPLFFKLLDKTTKKFFIRNGLIDVLLS